jgi:RNA polymerase sigma factor (sigma-70 family)
MVAPRALQIRETKSCVIAVAHAEVRRASGAIGNMADIDDEFASLIERVLAGSDSAANQLLKHYGPVIRQAVRCQLNKHLRSKFDSLDFVQDVWVSFLANPPEQEAFVEPAKLVAFLTRIARNKVVDATRDRLLGIKHNVNREYSLHDLAPGDCDHPAFNQPTPSEVFRGRELWDQLMHGQPLVHQRILILRRDGKELHEIAAEMGLSLRTVRRVIDKLRLRLAR